MKEIVNLTPHEISYHHGRHKRVIPPSGEVARVITREVQSWHESGYLLTRNVVERIDGLPEPSPTRVYIVSAWVARELPERSDLWVPARRVRRPREGVIGCRAFAV